MLRRYKRTSVRSIALEDRRTVQVEGNAYPVGADMPSIHATKISTIERSCVEKVLQNRDSESTRLRNTTEDNTTNSDTNGRHVCILDHPHSGPCTMTVMDDPTDLGKSKITDFRLVDKPVPVMTTKL